MANKFVWLDTNVIIYYLRHHPDFSPAIQKLVAQAQAGKITLKITPIVISECVFVLMGKQFCRKKDEIATALTSFINIKGIEMEEKDVIERALAEYAKHGIDFADAFIAEHAKAVTPAHVISENVKDFKKLNVFIQTPEDFLD